MSQDLRLYQLLIDIADLIKKGNGDQLEILRGEYNTSIQNIVSNSSVDSNCVDITFINVTAATVLVNGTIQVDNLVLNPGDFIEFNGNNAEINKTVYNVVFGSSATQCIIVKRLYNKR